MRVRFENNTLLAVHGPMNVTNWIQEYYHFLKNNYIQFFHLSVVSSNFGLCRLNCRLSAKMVSSAVPEAFTAVSRIA